MAGIWSTQVLLAGGRWYVLVQNSFWGVMRRDGREVGKVKVSRQAKEWASKVKGRRQIDR